MSDKCPNCGYSATIATHKVLNGTMNKYVNVSTGEVIVMAGSEVEVTNATGTWVIEAVYKKEMERRANMPSLPTGTGQQIQQQLQQEPVIKNREIPAEEKAFNDLPATLVAELQAKQQDKTIVVAPNGQASVAMSATEKLAQLKAQATQ